MRRSGFTLFEILLVVGAVAILGGVAIVAVTDTRESTRVAKLESDVATINAAIQVYSVNGGSLPSSATPQQIVNQLKKRADAATGSTIAGPRGSMVDLRLAVEMQTTGEGMSGQPRALWDGTAKRFKVVSGGPPGVKNFLLDDALAATDPGTEARTATVKADPGAWVWDYADVAATTSTGPATSPATSTAIPGIAPSAPTPLQLNAPVFSQTGGSLALINFDIPLTLTNPNPPGTSQIYYSVNGGPLSHYIGQTLTVTPGTSVSAFAVTSDPDHWTDSAMAVNTYQAIPVNLAVSLEFPKTQYTFQEAGGAMIGVPAAVPSPGVAVVTNTAAIPATYQSSSQFEIRWTLDGSDPLGSGTATVSGPFSGAVPPQNISFTADSWGTGSTLTVKAAAKAKTEWFVDSPVATSTIDIITTALAAPTIDPPSGAKAAEFPVSIALTSGQNYPVGARIYYTTDGINPGNNGGNPTSGTLYAGQFSTGAGTNGVVVVTARVYGPAGAAQWFTPSPANVTTYQTITQPEGALVGSATLNGTFVGSLIYASSSSGTMTNITFNSNAKILKGNLYLPGTPSIRLSNGTTWSAATDSAFANYIQGWEYDSNQNKTVQTTPRVINENGSITPDNYSVTFNSGALLEGKVVRRHNPPAFPTIPAPPQPDSSGSISLSSAPPGPISASQYSTVTLNSTSAGEVRLNAGNYANLTANNGTTFVLGDPDHPETTQVYSFQNLTLNSSSDVKIVGKVSITVGSTITINSGSVLGNSAHPEWLQMQFPSGGLTANSGSSAYGQLVAPNGSVVFNSGSTFSGSVTASSLTINSNGVVFSLPPTIQN